jgi:hypothetical protein
MGRGSRKKSHQEKQRSEPQPGIPSHQRLAEYILGLARLPRILIVVTLALFATLALSPIVDEIYIRFFFSMETRAIPYLISMTFGLLMYLVGWQLIVGTVGERLEYRKIMIWYLAVAGLSVLLVGVWFIRLLALGRAPIL